MYEELLKVTRPEERRHWCSDLHVVVKPETTAVIEKYDRTHICTVFRSRIDGEFWYRIPQAYTLWWKGWHDD